MSPEFSEYINTRDVGKFYVEQDEIGLGSLDNIKCASAVMMELYIVACRTESLSGQLNQIDFIIDDEYLDSTHAHQ